MGGGYPPELAWWTGGRPRTLVAGEGWGRAQGLDGSFRGGCGGVGGGGGGGVRTGAGLVDGGVDRALVAGEGWGGASVPEG